MSPSKIEAAVPIEKIDEIQSISVGTVDFSELDIGYNVFNFKASDITEYTITDSSARFKVTVNMTGLTSATFSVPQQNISITTQKEGYSATVIAEPLENIRIIGTTEEIAALTNEMIFAEVNLSEVSLQEGEQTVKVRIVIKGSTKAWASGTYSVRVRVTKGA